MTAAESGKDGSGATVVTIVKVLGDSPRFHGHFPGAPIFPAIATLCDLVLPAIRRAWPDLARVSEIRRMKLARPIRPETELSVQLTREPASARVDFVVLCESLPCAEGTVRFRVPA